MLDFLRQRSEAIRHLRPDTLDLTFVLDLGEPSVKSEAHRQVGDITLGNHHGRTNCDLWRPPVGNRRSDAGLKACHRLLQHLLIQLVTYLLDMPRLLVAEQIAGAANIEIVRGELEAGAQRVKRLQYLEAALGLRGNLSLCRQREQRIGAYLRPPYSPAQLIELRQPEAVGAMDDERVGGRNIEAGFNDGSREQQVVFAVIESRHDVVEGVRGHLPVRNGDAHLRHVLVEKFLSAGEVFDSRADVERLPTAIALAQQRLPYDQRIERRHESAHGQPIDRRRGDDGKITHAGQCELQRARNRGRCQRQNVDLGAELLELLLVTDAEMLLFVDNQQAEVLELDGPAEQRVSANDDIDLALSKALPDLRQFPARNEA